MFHYSSSLPAPQNHPASLSTCSVPFVAILMGGDGPEAVADGDHIVQLSVMY